MNTCVAKYAPKGKHLFKTTSLEARVKVTAGIYNVGYHYFWTEVMKKIELYTAPSVERFLLNKDKGKIRKFKGDHDIKIKAKQKAKEHDNLKKELKARFKVIEKNMEYSPMIGCNTMVGSAGSVKNKLALKVCKHKLYGCTGGGTARTAHKSEKSVYCTFYGKSSNDIKEIRDRDFLENPEAKAEYDRLYEAERLAPGTSKGGNVGGAKDKSTQRICRHKLYGCIGGGSARSAHKFE